MRGSGDGQPSDAKSRCALGERPAAGPDFRRLTRGTRGKSAFQSAHAGRVCSERFIGLSTPKNKTSVDNKSTIGCAGRRADRSLHRACHIQFRPAVIADGYEFDGDRLIAE
jgi:hypothetical protein